MRVFDKDNLVLDFIKDNPSLSSKEIHEGLNDITEFKKIFIDQFEFAVSTYF